MAEETKVLPAGAAPESSPAADYTDDNIRHLSDMEHVRTRPGMYMVLRVCYEC